MTIKPTPGNQPDTNDMADSFANDAESKKGSPAIPNSEEAEDEAARLGDFA